MTQRTFWPNRSTRTTRFLRETNFSDQFLIKTLSSQEKNIIKSPSGVEVRRSLVVGKFLLK